MRAHAANSAARAAIGGDDVLSKWQLMAEQARQKRDGAVSLSASPRSPDKNQEFGGNGLFTAAKAGKTFFVKHCFFPPLPYYPVYSHKSLENLLFYSLGELRWKSRVDVIISH